MTKKKRNGKLQRREFMKTVATGGGLLGAGQQLTASDEKPAGGKPEQKAAQPGAERNASRIAFPRSFTGRNLPMIAFPLGGLGTGSISLGGRGQLRYWEIFNRPDKGNSPEYGFPAIWVQAGRAKPVARVLEARLQPPYDGQDGLAAKNAPGLPRFESATFTGAYPVARILFRNKKVPVGVSLEAFNPLVPLNPEASGIRCAILRYKLHNQGSVPAKRLVLANRGKRVRGNVSATLGHEAVSVTKREEGTRLVIAFKPEIQIMPKQPLTIERGA